MPKVPATRDPAHAVSDQALSDQIASEDSLPCSGAALLELLERNPNLGFLLEIELPLSAILASKSLPLKAILDLDVGSVIVFDKNDSEPISLHVNNVEVGSGKTIKVGDHFGLHLRNRSRSSVIDAVS